MKYYYCIQCGMHKEDIRPRKQPTCSSCGYEHVIEITKTEFNKTNKYQRESLADFKYRKEKKG